LDQRYNALLQMYGEKVEETEELKLDLQDIKEMYKSQVTHLLTYFFTYLLTWLLLDLAQQNSCPATMPNVAATSCATKEMLTSLRSHLLTYLLTWLLLDVALQPCRM